MPPRANGPRRSAAQVEKDFLRVMAELRMVLQTDALPHFLVQVMLGYAHPQSTGFHNAKTKFRKSGFIKVSNGSINLSPEGILALPQDVNPPKSNREFQERLRELLHQRAKPTAKFDIIFNALLNGEDHTKAGLRAAAGYNHPLSTGFVKSMQALKEFDLLDKSVGSKKVRLNNKVFPLGRPNDQRPEPSPLLAAEDPNKQRPEPSPLPALVEGSNKQHSDPSPLLDLEASVPFAFSLTSSEGSEVYPALPTWAPSQGPPPVPLETTDEVATLSDSPQLVSSSSSTTSSFGGSVMSVPAPVASLQTACVFRKSSRCKDSNPVAPAAAVASAPYPVPLPKKKIIKSHQMIRAASALGFSFRPKATSTSRSDSTLPPLKGSVARF